MRIVIENGEAPGQVKFEVAQTASDPFAPGPREVIGTLLLISRSIALEAIAPGVPRSIAIAGADALNSLPKVIT